MPQTLLDEGDAIRGDRVAINAQGAVDVVSTEVIHEMQTEIEKLKVRVAALEDEVTALRALETEEEIIVLRTISREQAKKEISELFQSGGVWYYSDIARRLRFDLPLVVELCQELQLKEEIEVDADAL